MKTEGLSSILSAPTMWMKLNIKILKKLSKMILICIAKFRKVCIDTNCLDEQWFLGYQDTLNILSIDPDRQ